MQRKPIGTVVSCALQKKRKKEVRGKNKEKGDQAVPQFSSRQLPTKISIVHKQFSLYVFYVTIIT